MTSSRRVLVLLAGLLAAALAGVALVAPASVARTVEVVLTERGPAAVEPAPGDSVRFVNSETGQLLGQDRVGRISAPVPAWAPAPQQPAAAAPLPAGEPATQGPLPGASTSRPLGLPSALAVLAALGVTSLLVRVLLAEPAAAPSLRRAPVTAQAALSGGRAGRC